MSIKISELPQATSVGSSDIVPIVQDGTTKQATAGMIGTARNVLTAIGRGTNLSTSNTYTLIPLVLFASQGSKLTVNSNGEIVIGDNVSQILISGKCVFTSHTAGTKYFAIYQNNTKVFTSYKSIAKDEADELACPSYLMNVSAGDRIGLYAYGSSNDNINGSANATEPVTYLTIEVISTGTQTRTLNLAKTTNTGSLVGLGDKAEVTDETLEKVKLDEVTDKDVGEQITEAKEETKEAVTEVKEEIKDEKGSGDNE